MVSLDLKRFIHGYPHDTTPIDVEWNPSLFAKAATAATWNANLLVLSSVLANNAYFQKTNNEPENTWRYYESGRGDIADTLDKLGFLNVRCEHSRNGNHCNYVTFAQQIIHTENEEYQLIAVMLRGTVDETEWASNFVVNNRDYVAGLRRAQRIILLSLKEYVDCHDVGLPRKIWITGHSRGGAIANLLAADLNVPKNRIALQKDIYAYTFAALNVAKNSVIPLAGDCSNIWNFVNPLDIVPYFPFSDGWDYGKFGTNVRLPLDESIEENYQRFSGFSPYEKYQSFSVEDMEQRISALAKKFPVGFFVKVMQAPMAFIIEKIFSLDIFVNTKLSGLKSPKPLGRWLGLQEKVLGDFIYAHTPEMYVAQSIALANSTEKEPSQ